MNGDVGAAIRTRLVDAVSGDARIRAAWLEGPTHAGASRVEVHLALDEADFAGFYRDRHAWLRQALAPVHVHDVRDPWIGCVALTRDGVLVTVVLETWGSLPERPRRHVDVLLDRTGRLSERLRPWTPPERVEFAHLDRWAADVWLAVWEAVHLAQRDVAGFLAAVARAVQAYLAFVAACRGEDPQRLAWQGELASAADLDPQVLTQAPRALLRTVAERMRTHGRSLGEARGWRYPADLEQVVWRLLEREETP